MPTPVYVALHSVLTNLNLGSAAQRALIGTTALVEEAPLVRATRVGQMVAAAYQYLVAQATANNEQATALYVYVGPEYLLQRSYSMRTVKEDEKTQIVNHLAAVSNACPGMLMMPGTLTWRKKKGFERSFLRQPADAYNSAFLFFNGAMVHRHDKNEDVGELQALDLTKNTRFDSRPRARFVHGAHSGRFVCNLLDFGIEICGDHGQGTLAAGGQVDIHLLTSASVSHAFNAAGMPRIAARDGGVFVHCNDQSGRAGGTALHGVWEIDRRNAPQAVAAAALGGVPPVNIQAFRATLT